MRKVGLLLAVVLIAGFTYSSAGPEPKTAVIFSAPQIEGYLISDNYRPLSRNIGSADLNVAALIHYDGDEDSGTVDLNAGNLELFDGDLASEAVDTDAADGGCDVEDQGDIANAACGVATGIDLAANAACDTWGELMVIVNRTANWHMVLIDAGYDEQLNAAGVSLIDPADAQAKGPAGLALLMDTSEADGNPISLIPGEGTGPATGGGDVYSNMEIWMQNDEARPEAIYAGQRTYLTYWSYSYDDGDNDDTVAYVICEEQGKDWTTRTIFTYGAAADDTTYNKDWTQFPLGCRMGERMVLQIYSANTAAAANTFSYAVGFSIVE
jgi:hypothetical protein